MFDDVLLYFYPWMKSFHIMSVISWMAGLFYFPRLLVNHVEQSRIGDQVDIVLQKMEEKLFRIIMTPAMMATWGFGLILAFTPGVIDWSDIWPYVKVISIFSMTWFHVWLGKRKNDFAVGKNSVSSKRYRLMNEVPTVLMIVIVFSVIFKF